MAAADSWSSKYQHGTSLGDSDSWPSSLSSGWWGTVRNRVCRSVVTRHGESTVSVRDNQYVPRFGIYRIHSVTESNRERHGDGNRYPRGQSQTRSGLRFGGTSATSTIRSSGRRLRCDGDDGRGGALNQLDEAHVVRVSRVGVSIEARESPATCRSRFEETGRRRRSMHGPGSGGCGSRGAGPPRRCSRRR